MRTTRGRDRTPGRARSLGLAVTWVATILGGIGTVPGSVHAQPSAAARRAPRIPELAVPNAPRAADAARAENALLRRFGLDVPQGLTKGDSPDDWVRAVERARSIGTDDAVAFLVSTAAADDDGPRGSAIVDLALARALARVPPTPAVQKALEGIVTSPASNGGSTRDLARAVAALGLARSGDASATALLLALVERDGTTNSPAYAALVAAPPRRPFRFDAATATPGLVSLAGDFGDLRAAPSIVPLLVARSAGLRRAAVSALGRLRDAHILAHAATLAADPSADVRVAYARATMDLGVPDVRSITKLVADDDTVSAAVDLARSVDHPDVARALAARAKVSTDAELRGRAFGALASQSNVTAVEVLEAFAVTDADPYPSAFALARSASPLAARVLARTAARVTGVARRHALRACLVRRLDGRDPCPDLHRLVEVLARSTDAVDKDLAAFARVTIAAGSSFAAPAGANASVKRSVAPLVLIAGKEALGAMRATWRSEPDASTRHALGVAFVPLADGDVDRDVPSSTLRARVDEASVDLAALAPHAIARSVGAEDRATRLLDAPDPAVRFAAYRGLAFATFPSATGRLADALVKATDVRARRLLVRALVARGVGPTVAPVRSDVLALVRETDPDPTVRTWATPSGSPDADVLRARRALVCGGGSDVAWVHVTDGREPRGTVPIEGTLRTSDGCAYPVVFDADGDAIVPGIPGGDVDVVLAPVFPTYDSRDHDGQRQGRDGEETIHR